MPLHPDVFGELRAQEVRNLPNIVERLLWMGIGPCGGPIPYERIDQRVFLMADGLQTFARRINYPPWNKHLRRKAEARQRRIDRLQWDLVLDRFLGTPDDPRAAYTHLAHHMDRFLELERLWGLEPWPNSEGAQRRTRQTPRRT